jgi:hypothetical protein
MALGIEHPADDEPLGRPHSMAQDALDLGARKVEHLDELGRRERRGDVVLEPEAGKQHQPNCSRNRTSLS